MQVLELAVALGTGGQPRNITHSLRTSAARRHRPASSARSRSVGGVAAQRRLVGVAATTSSVTPRGQTAGAQHRAAVVGLQGHEHHELGHPRPRTGRRRLPPLRGRARRGHRSAAHLDGRPPSTGAPPAGSSGSGRPPGSGARRARRRLLPGTSAASARHHVVLRYTVLPARRRASTTAARSAPVFWAPSRLAQDPSESEPSAPARSPPAPPRPPDFTEATAVLAPRTIAPVATCLWAEGRLARSSTRGTSARSVRTPPGSHSLDAQHGLQLPRAGPCLFASRAGAAGVDGLSGRGIPAGRLAEPRRPSTPSTRRWSPALAPDVRSRRRPSAPRRHHRCASRSRGPPRRPRGRPVDHRGDGATAGACAGAVCPPRRHLLGPAPG